jgi:hypothetical protein
MSLTYRFYRFQGLTAMCLKFLANLVGTLELFIRVGSACFHTCAVIGVQKRDNCGN